MNSTTQNARRNHARSARTGCHSMKYAPSLRFFLEVVRFPARVRKLAGVFTQVCSMLLFAASATAYEVSPDIYVFPVSKFAHIDQTHPPQDPAQIPKGSEGFLILSLPANEPLYAAGLRSGDIVTQLNGGGIADVKQFFGILREHDLSAASLEVTVLKPNPALEIATLGNRNYARLHVTAASKTEKTPLTLDQTTKGLLGILKQRDDEMREASTENAIVENLIPIVGNSIDTLFTEFERSVLACMDKTVATEEKACMDSVRVQTRHIRRESTRLNVLKPIAFLYDGHKEEYLNQLRAANEELPAFEPLVRTLYQYAMDKAAGRTIDERAFLERIRPAVQDPARLTDPLYGEFVDTIHSRAHAFANGPYIEKLRSRSLPQPQAQPQPEAQAKPVDSTRNIGDASQADQAARVTLTETQVRMKKDYELQCRQTDQLANTRARLLLSTKQNPQYKALPKRVILKKGAITKDVAMERCIKGMVKDATFSAFDAGMYEYLQRTAAMSTVDEMILCDKDRKIHANMIARKANNKNFTVTSLKGGQAAADVEKCLKNPDKYLN